MTRIAGLGGVGPVVGLVPPAQPAAPASPALAQLGVSRLPARLGRGAAVDLAPVPSPAPQGPTPGGLAPRGPAPAAVTRVGSVTIAGSPGAPAEQEGDVALAGVDHYAVTLPTAYETADYTITLTAQRDQATGGAVVPTWDNRTKTGFTVYFSAPYTGLLHWEAKAKHV